MNEWVRKVFGPFTPTYGNCGGMNKDCAINALDPLDKLFYAHDNDLNATEGLLGYEKTKARSDADKKLYDGLMALTEEDFKQIPSWQWKPPFFKRSYARKYRKWCLEIFRPKT